MHDFAENAKAGNVKKDSNQAWTLCEFNILRCIAKLHQWLA